MSKMSKSSKSSQVELYNALHQIILTNSATTSPVTALLQFAFDDTLSKRDRKQIHRRVILKLQEGTVFYPEDNESAEHVRIHFERVPGSDLLWFTRDSHTNVVRECIVEQACIYTPGFGETWSYIYSTC